MSGLSLGTALSFGSTLYGQFSDSTTQAVVNPGTPQVVTFDTTVIANGVSIVSSGGKASRLTVSQSGKYLINISVVINETDNNDGAVQVWFSHNGTSIPNSNTYITTIVPNLYLCTSVSIIATAVNSNDYFEIVLSGDYTSQAITSIAASGSIPASPSIILTILKISD